MLVRDYLYPAKADFNSIIGGRNVCSLNFPLIQVALAVTWKKKREARKEHGIGFHWCQLSHKADGADGDLFFFLSFSGRKGWARISGCCRRLRGWWFHRRYWRKGCKWASWKESELLFVMQFTRNGGEEAPYKEASSVYIILRKICCVTCVTV